MDAPILEFTNNPCKFCNKTLGNGEPIFGQLDEGNVVAISNNEYDGWCLEIWAHYGCEASHKINYCPFCGRKLTEEG